MKFYKGKTYIYPDFIFETKQTCIYCYSKHVQFFKDGMYHNDKNADYIYYDGNIKDFSLNDKFYGDETDFTKKSWRRFVKLQAFL